MSGAARKARKAAGEKLTRTPKVGTPLFKRAEYRKASPRRRQEMAEARGLKVPAEKSKSIPTIKVRGRQA